MNLLFKIIPKIASILTNNLIDRVFLISKLWIFVISRKLSLSHKEFRIDVVFNKKEITFYLLHVNDLAVLQEIFIKKEYEWFPSKNTQTIIDLGAHFGDTALYYNAIFPDAKIIAVEPSPENYKRLVRHTENIPNIIAVQSAVGGDDGETTLNIMPSSLGHSVMERVNSKETITVSKLSLKTLLEQQNINKVDLLKFDIEGAEFEMLKNIPREVSVDAFIGELHFDLDENYNINWIKEYFKEYNTKFEKLNNQNRFIVKASHE